MGWVWSDELAVALRNSPDVDIDIPASWVATPSALAVGTDEDLVSAGMRLLDDRAVPHSAARAAADRPGRRPLRVCDCNHEAETEAMEPTALTG